MFDKGILPRYQMELLPHVHMLDDPTRANCYLIVGEGETTMIDVGMNADTPKVRALLRQNDVPVNGLQNIIITHAHTDHYQALAAVKAAEGGKVMVHEEDADFVNGTRKMPLPHGGVKVLFFLLAPMLRCRPTEVDRRLKEGDSIDAFGGLQVLHLPGHTPGSIALYSERRKMLFCGDALGNRKSILSVPFQYKYHKEECDLTFSRIAELDIDVLLPGHGPPILKGAGDKVKEFAAQVTKEK
jgi:glyoxylase-like metal-dependent hydrolase (beta-lactamase superfamily II)